MQINGTCLPMFLGFLSKNLLLYVMMRFALF